MTVVRDDADNAVAATVFTAIVGKSSDSDTVQLEVDDDGTLRAIVSGDVLDNNNIKQNFEKVTVEYVAGNSIEVVFDSGVYLLARGENGFISFFQVNLPEIYRREVQGLLGNYNGDDTDDLLPQFGDTPLPSDSDIEDIHNNFGITCE